MSTVPFLKPQINSKYEFEGLEPDGIFTSYQSWLKISCLLHKKGSASYHSGTTEHIKVVVFQQQSLISPVPSQHSVSLVKVTKATPLSIFAREVLITRTSSRTLSQVTK